MSKKLNLKELKVTSFVTAAEYANSETIKGGRLNAPTYRRTGCLPGATTFTDPVELPSRGALNCSAFAPFACVDSGTGSGCL
ncbi:MAG: pinensin family lanthipeptide [Bacteroidota bacterium]